MSKVFSNKLLFWTDNVLQGLAYWLGYKKQYYRFYPLSEGAIVEETLSLLAANLDLDNKRLNAEVMYKRLYTKEDQTRADIVISAKPKEKKVSKKEFDYSVYAENVIEVKLYKGKASLQDIEQDFSRLADCLAHGKQKSLRCFLILVSQQGIPKPYVTDNGQASKKAFPVNGSSGFIAKTRRVCKAVGRFDKLDGKDKAANVAFYACLLEVLPNKSSDGCKNG